jgi:heme oxygenase
VIEEQCDLDIQRLRRETRDGHQAVEDCLPLMGDEPDTSLYVRCLGQIHGVVAAWEDRAVEIAPDWMLSTLAARQRKHMLELDLAWFGIKDQDERRPILSKINDLPSLLGAMYVMEGSTLGGQLIARHLEATLHLSQGKGDAYFCDHGDQTGRLWKEFGELLTMRVADDQADAVVASAKVMFAAFGEWMGKPATNGN